MQFTSVSLVVTCKCKSWKDLPVSFPGFLTAVIRISKWTANISIPGYQIWLSQTFTSSELNDSKVYQSNINQCQDQWNNNASIPHDIQSQYHWWSQISASNPNQMTAFTLSKLSLEDPKWRNSCKSSNFNGKGKNSIRWKMSDCIFCQRDY